MRLPGGSIMYFRAADAEAELHHLDWTAEADNGASVERISGVVRYELDVPFVEVYDVGRSNRSREVVRCMHCSP